MAGLLLQTPDQEKLPGMAMGNAFGNSARKIYKVVAD